MKERTKLLFIVLIFLACYYVPWASPTIRQSGLEAFMMLQEYARDHVLTCLIPAFFIAGAIGVFVSQGAVLKYFGATANKILSYSVASVSGTILAVCSCTVLPLFAGIYARGAGIGPATAFLYSGPAINVLAIVLTARILGWQLGLARAIGAVDIALWDISAKRAGLPLHACLGGAVRTRIPGYASLLKYRDPELVGAMVAKAREEGYDAIKIHETEVDEVRAAREAAGSGIPLMVDTNCPWTPEQARLMASRLREFDLHWLEEPIFPPEDFAALARLGRESGIPIAAGENACTSFEFAKMFDAGAVQYAQPSVTKVGGVTELRKVATLAEAAGVALMPHSPYFGPGFLATIQLAAADPVDCLLERFYCDLEASLYGDLIDTVSGEFRVPDGPGLGCEPDPDVIKEYGVSDG